MAFCRALISAAHIHLRNSCSGTMLAAEACPVPGNKSHLLPTFSLTRLSAGCTYLCMSCGEYDGWKTASPGDCDESKPCRSCGVAVDPEDDFCGGCEEEMAILDDVEAARVAAQALLH